MNWITNWLWETLEYDLKGRVAWRIHPNNWSINWRIWNILFCGIIFIPIKVWHNVRISIPMCIGLHFVQYECRFWFGSMYIWSIMNNVLVDVTSSDWSLDQLTHKYQYNYYKQVDLELIVVLISTSLHSYYCIPFSFYGFTIIVNCLASSRYLEQTEGSRCSNAVMQSIICFRKVQKGFIRVVDRGVNKGWKQRSVLRKMSCLGFFIDYLQWKSSTSFI